MTATCKSITFSFTGFPNANNNTVTESVYVDGVLVHKGTFSFNGPSGSNTITIGVPAGKHKVDGKVKWNTNGFSGNFDTPVQVTCPTAPDFAIEKLQRIAGLPGHFTTATIPGGKVGETVDYEIIVINTGGVPLKFSNFTDPKCDPGTISGGPGESAVAPGASTTYFCDHVLTTADREAGFYTNTATDTGTPEEGSPITKESNPVVVELPTPGGTAEGTCNSLTFTFKGFPNLPNNKVTEMVFIDGKLVYKGTFTFNGPSGSNTITVTVPPGNHKVDGKAKWNTNGFSGGFDKFNQVKCAATPGFSLTKLQEIAGSGGGFTTSQLKGKVGQTVDYEIVATNTGNVPLTFSSFTDPKCDAGTISGGPGASPVAPGASTTYLCDHVLTEADKEAGSYSNVATDTGTPPEGDGAPITSNSNTVVVEVPSIN